ncbi:MAG: alpha/beta fold hydrolase [Deinococcota bacterium]|nr:alpha/beta fold hydrolase [Deinococcota bacterium]
MPLTGQWTHRQAIVNGVRLHYVEAGEGPLVILLHGFPEFWYSWRLQIPVLAKAGFYVIAPDMRGYNTSEKPPGVRSYELERLTADVAALVEHAGAECAVVVGHDWGGALAWHLPAHYPALVSKLVIMNAPHPAAFERELRTWQQLKRSWYIGFFQLPWLPETVIRLAGRALLERVFREGSSHPEAFSDEDIDRYHEAIHQPGALTASINYYRAFFRRALRPGGPNGHPTVTVPTLLLWGERDDFLVPALSEGLEPYVPKLRLERIPEAGHWLQLDAPERVNRALLDFLADLQARPSG